MRHGETTGQSSIRYYGRTDLELSELGRRQMERVRQALEGEDFDAVYCSPLRRARTGAQIVRPSAAPIPVEGFTEINFGDWEGLTREEIEARHPELYRRWRASIGDFEYPGGDSAPRFRQRVHAALGELLPTAPPRLLIVAHKGVIGAIVTHLLGLSDAQRAELAIELASVHVLSAGPRGWLPSRLDIVDHLEDLR